MRLFAKIPFWFRMGSFFLEMPTVKKITCFWNVKLMLTKC
jgi:hypothetical protein